MPGTVHRPGVHPQSAASRDRHHCARPNGHAGPHRRRSPVHRTAHGDWGTDRAGWKRCRDRQQESPSHECVHPRWAGSTGRCLQLQIADLTPIPMKCLHCPSHSRATNDPLDFRCATATWLVVVVVLTIDAIGARVACEPQSREETWRVHLR